MPCAFKPLNMKAISSKYVVLDCFLLCCYGLCCVDAAASSLVVAFDAGSNSIKATALLSHSLTGFHG